jgi:hypothetical protein
MLFEVRNGSRPPTLGMFTHSLLNRSPAAFARGIALHPAVPADASASPLHVRAGRSAQDAGYPLTRGCGRDRGRRPSAHARASAGRSVSRHPRARLLNRPCWWTSCAAAPCCVTAGLAPTLHFSPYAALRRLTWPCPSRRARLIAVLWIQSLPFACTLRLVFSARRGCCAFEYLRYIQPKVGCALWDCRTCCLLSPRRAIRSLSYHCSFILSTTRKAERAACFYREVHTRIPRTRHRTGPSSGWASLRRPRPRPSGQRTRPAPVAHPVANTSRPANGGPRCTRPSGSGGAFRPELAPPPSARPCRHARGRQSPGGADGVAPCEGA